MADGRSFALPDLPNAGYATYREKALSDAVMQFMREVERNRLRLLTIVCEGRERWRTVAQGVWRGLRIGEDHQLLDAIYDYFTLQALPPKAQRAWLDQPGKRRDIVRATMPRIEREREQVRLLQKWAP